MESRILFGKEVREALFEGIRELSDAVTTTLGPLGHTVVLNRGYNLPYVTKDGVTVARAYETNDTVKGMGAMLVKMAAAKTCDEAGDGTTTTVLLARRIIEEGIKSLSSGDKFMNAREFRKGMEDGLQIALDKLKFLSHTIAEDDFDTIRKIALVSANGDEEIAELIVNAVSQVGRDGVITVEESPNRSEMSVEVTTGFHWNKGLISPYFVTDPERVECVLDNPYIMVLNNRINYLQEIVNVVQDVYTEHRALLIVAPDISPDALKFLTQNIQRGNLKAAFVKAPGYGQIQKELMEDLACRVGTIAMDADVYSSPIQLGGAPRVIISSNQTIIVGGKGEPDRVSERVSGIRYQLESATNAFDKEKLRERIAYLTGGTAVLYVCGESEVELKERKDRVDDAVAAVKSALEEGYVAGCGVCATQLAVSIIESDNDLDTYSTLEGKVCIARALYSVNRTILENAGIKPEEENEPCDWDDWSHDVYWLNSNAGHPEPKGFVEEFNKSVDPITGLVENVFDNGIIDPTKVLRCALTNAVSVAIQFLNTDCIIATPVEQK